MPSRRPHTSTRAAPHSGSKPIPAPEARAPGRLAELHAQPRDGAERVDEHRRAAGHGAAVAAADRFGEPHEPVALRMFLAPAAVVPRVHERRVVRDAPCRRTPGPAQPVRATRISSIFSNIAGRVHREHVGEPRREPAADRDRDVGGSRVRSERARVLDRVVLVVARRDRNAGRDRRGDHFVVDAGGQRGRDDVDVGRDRVAGREVDRPRRADRARRRLRRRARRCGSASRTRSIAGVSMS